MTSKTTYMRRRLFDAVATTASRSRRTTCRFSVQAKKTPPAAVPAATSTAAPSLKIWEYRIGDAAASVSTTKGDDSSSSPMKQTLYTPSGSGWDSATIHGSKPKKDEGALPDSNASSQSNKLPSMDELSLQVQRHVVRHFLPAGYPTSVAPGYSRYVAYCVAANTFGAASMVLSTQTLLLAVGVGSTSAAPMAAAINWVLKDGIGQFGGILFASRLGSAANSSIDADPKRWRVASSISMDCATWLEILSPLFPQYFLPIASVANVGKNIGFLTASASRAAIHQALALKSNLGDVTAKAGSQSILASLAGTTLGISVSPFLHGDVTNVACGFALLSVLHQYCTYNAVRSVHLRNLNRHRLNLVLETFVESIISASAKADTEHPVLSPAEVAEVERFLPFIHKDETKKWLKIGVSVNELFPEISDFEHVRNCIGEKEHYLINYESGTGDTAENVSIRLTFLKDAQGTNLIRGCLHAHILRAMLTSHKGNDASDMIRVSYGEMLSLVDSLLELLEKKGWEISTETVQVEAGSAKRLNIEGA